MSDDLLGRVASAKHLGIGARTFDLHVRPGLIPVRIGRRVLFRREDLDAWVEGQQAGASGSARRAMRTRSVSRGPAPSTSLPLEQPIPNSLRVKRRASMPTWCRGILSQDDAPKPSQLSKG